MAKAYLVLRMKANGGPFPEIHGVGITSTNPMGNYQLGHFETAILEVEDEKFWNAHQKIIDRVMSDNRFAWIRPWFTKGKKRQQLLRVRDAEVNIIGMLSKFAKALSE